jgi:hypothetical protein
MGHESFTWFVGTVEDVTDPLMLGRVKIRVVGETDNTAIQTSDLKWALPWQGITSAAANGVGLSPTGIANNSMVVGFYMDGMEKQMPTFFGTYAKMPGGTANTETNDVPALARGTNTIQNSQLGPEPAPAYNAQYPWNLVYVSRAGHVIEVDDTPGQERIRLYHKSGTYTEINSEGRQVTKIVGDAYEIIANNQNVYVGGNANVAVQGNISVTVQGDAVVNITGTAKATAASWDITGDTTINGTLTVTENITGQAALAVTGNMTGQGSLTVSGDVKGGSISLDQHTHSGVQAGGASTGPAQG